MIYKMKKIFCCYSVDLRDFLYKKGIKYEICGLNPNNNHMFWAYIKNEKLNTALIQWSNKKG